MQASRLQAPRGDRGPTPPAVSAHCDSRLYLPDTPNRGSSSAKGSRDKQRFFVHEKAKTLDQRSGLG